MRRKNFRWNGADPRLIKLWFNIQSRCNYSGDKKYKNYGGRDIRNLLKKDDLIFLWDRDRAATMTQPSIDRKDGNDNYTLKNCRFIEMRENRKKRGNKKDTFRDWLKRKQNQRNT